MAHQTQVTGTLSELLAAASLLENGWEVAIPAASEVYDLVGKDPVNGKWYTFQVKTIRRRTDRKGELVVYAKKGNGDAYSLEDCDYLLGVLDDSVFMFENRGLREYWASDEAAETRWVRLRGEPFDQDARYV